MWWARSRSSGRPQRAPDELEASQFFIPADVRRRGLALSFAPAASRPATVAVAQLVRASGCGPEGRGFKSRQPPCSRVFGRGSSSFRRRRERRALGAPPRPRAGLAVPAVLSSAAVGPLALDCRSRRRRRAGGPPARAARMALVPGRGALRRGGHAAFVYRLGLQVFNLARRVRFPYAVRLGRPAGPSWREGRMGDASEVGAYSGVRRRGARRGWTCPDRRDMNRGRGGAAEWDGALGGLAHGEPCKRSHSGMVLETECPGCPSQPPPPG